VIIEIAQRDEKHKCCEHVCQKVSPGARSDQRTSFMGFSKKSRGAARAAFWLQLLNSCVQLMYNINLPNL